jgi:tetratricopeptide (TPR) repeat protein
MRAGMRVLFLVATISAGWSTVAGQTAGEVQLERSIHAGELAVGSTEGRRDGLSWLRLAILYQDAARYDDAERAFCKATALLKTADGERYADALDGMGVMYVELGKYTKAEVLERKALATRQGEQNAVALGRSYMHLSLVAYGKHDMRGAEADAEMAVSLLARERSSEAHTEKASPEEQMSALIDLALIRCAEGQCGAATHDLERAMHLATANYPANSVPVGFVHFLLGYAHTKNGNAQNGVALMKMGIEEMKSQMGWGHPTYIAALREYRSALLKAGREAEGNELGDSIAKLGGSARTGDPGVLGFPGVKSLR